LRAFQTETAESSCQRTDKSILRFLISDINNI
jgi:hypothetical protein